MTLLFISCAREKKKVGKETGRRKGEEEEKKKRNAILLGAFGLLRCLYN